MWDIKEQIDLALEEFKTELIGGFFDGIKNSVTEFFKWLSITIIDGSYTICLSVAIIGLIFYCAGYKKGAKAVTISIIVFVVLQAIKVVLL